MFATSIETQKHSNMIDLAAIINVGVEEYEVSDLQCRKVQNLAAVVWNNNNAWSRVIHLIGAAGQSAVIRQRIQAQWDAVHKT